MELVSRTSFYVTVDGGAVQRQLSIQRPLSRGRGEEITRIPAIGLGQLIGSYVGIKVGNILEFLLLGRGIMR